MVTVDTAEPLASRAKDVVFNARGDSSSPDKSPDARSRRSAASGNQAAAASTAASSSHDGSSRPSSRATGSGFLVDEPASIGPSTLLRDRTARNTASFPRVLGDSARLGSPLSRELPMDNIEAPFSGTRAPSPRMDPAQLVQMALDLSDSRRRQSGRALQAPASVQHAPEFALKYDPVRSRHSATRSTPSPLHDGPSTESPIAGRESALPVAGIRLSPAALDASPATMSRAERARRYFELAAEHRRVLACLPSENNRNPRQLGRQYNPLKTLRNRRDRPSQELTAPVEAWLDIDAVKAWVDDLEAAASSDPKLFDIHDHPLPFAGDGANLSAFSKGHLRSNTATSVLVKPENFWAVGPVELLEDLYWSELNPSKKPAVLQNGQDPHRMLDSTSRSRVDRERIGEDVRVGVSDGPDSDTNDTHGEERIAHRKHLLTRRRRRVRSSSVATVSSDDGSRPREDGAEVNVGPLERHMREIISKHENGSLDLESPNHWEHGNNELQTMKTNPRPQPLRSTSASGRPRAVTVTSMTSDDPDLYPVTVAPKPKSKLHRLPMFRNKDSTMDQMDGADGQSFRHSLDLPRPGFGRHRTTESWSGSPKRSETFGSPDGREATSSMQRLLKGGRFGDYVRNEGARLRSKKQTENAIKVETEDQSSSENNDNVQTIDFGDGNEKQKYYLPDLPTFTSRKRANDREQVPTDKELTDLRSELPALSTIESQRHWSISDRGAQSATSSSVTAREVARVRALLLASGVKASELINGQQTNAKEDAAGQESSVQIHGTLDSAEQCLQSQRQVAESLNRRLEELLDRASTLLTHDATDQADQFTAELMSKAPQDVRGLDDAINTILRRQRRQFRIFRRTGFKLLEIFLLFFFRFLWLIFMLFTSIRGIVVAFFRVVRWLCVF